MSDYVVDPVTGEIVDPRTGEVIEDHPIAMEPEWRAYTAEEFNARARASGSITFRVHDMGLATYIVRGDRELEGVDRYSPKAKKLEKLNRRVRASDVPRKTMSALVELNRWCARLELPDTVCEEAARIARKAMMLPRMLTKWRYLIIAAAVAIAIELHGIPMTKKDVAKIMEVDYRAMMRVVKEIKKGLGIRSAPPSPKIFAQRLASDLKLDNDVAVLALRIIDELERKSVIGGKHPMSIAIAAIYLASVLLNKRLTQETIARASGFSTASIRNCYRFILSKLDIEVVM